MELLKVVVQLLIVGLFGGSGALGLGRLLTCGAIVVRLLTWLRDIHFSFVWPILPHEKHNE